MVSLFHHGAAPVVYLKPFSIPKRDTRTNRIALVSENSPIKIKKISKVNIVANQYTLQNTPWMPDIVEDGWNDLYERPYAKVRDKLLDNVWPLNSQDRLILSNFMAMSYVKDHRRIDKIRESAKDYTVDSLFHSAGIDKSVLYDLLKPHSLFLKDKGNLHLLYRTTHYSKVLSLYRKWYLLKSETPLFTGNTPLSLLTCHNDGAISTSLDTGLRNFNICLFPISRNTGVFFLNESKHGKYVEGEYDTIVTGEKYSSLFRKAILRSSNELYIHPDDLDQVLELEDFSSFNVDRKA